MMRVQQHFTKCDDANIQIIMLSPAHNTQSAHKGFPITHPHELQRLRDGGWVDGWLSSDFSPPHQTAIHSPLQAAASFGSVLWIHLLMDAEDSLRGKFG